MILVQVWAVPALNLATWGIHGDFVVSTPQPVKIREVDYVQEGGQTFKILLLETWDPETALAADEGCHFRPIATVLSRISFGVLSRIRPFAGRLIPNPPEPGQSYEGIEFFGPPPGFPFHSFVMGTSQKVLDSRFLGGNVPPNVEGAISWFIAGSHAIQSPIAVMCNWLGIEMLTPEKKQPLRCPNKGCEKEIPLCPECHQSMTSKQATKAIIDYLTSEFSMTKKDARELYQGRNDIAHGRIRLDEAGIKAVSSHLEKTQEILLAGIKKALGWPKDAPPAFSTCARFGAMRLTVPHVMEDGSYLDLPVNAPNWHTFEATTPMGRFRGILALAGILEGLGV